MLTDEQWLELYTATIETQKDMIWVKGTLENNHQDIDNCFKRVNALEIDDSFKKGKIVSLAMLVTALVTIMVNGVLWAFNSFGGVI